MECSRSSLELVQACALHFLAPDSFVSKFGNHFDFEHQAAACADPWAPIVPAASSS